MAIALHDILDTVRVVVPIDGYALADLIWRHSQGEVLDDADHAALRAMRERAR